MAEFKFRLPTEFTREQKRAIEDDHPIFVTGVPGSGKTTVSIMRLNQQTDSILFTYGKMLRLAIAQTINSKSNNMIRNIHDWNYELTKVYLEENLKDINKMCESYKSKGIKYKNIFVDEGQDLWIEIYQLFKSISPNVSVGADEAQTLFEHGASEEEITNILSLKKHHLTKNHRNTFEIFNFARYFVPHNPRANDAVLLESFKKGDADKPFLYILNTLDETVEYIKKILNNNKGTNIGILSTDILTVNTYTKKLKNDFEISSYTSENKDVPTNLKSILITTIKSAKGMEFDIVIMPGFQFAKSSDANQYFVGATRAKTQLFIFSIGKIPDITENIDKSAYNIKDER